LYFFVLQKDLQNIIFNNKLITGLCCSLNDEFIVYIGEENGELTKINVVNGKTDFIKKISYCNLTLMNINPIRFVLFFLVLLILLRKRTILKLNYLIFYFICNRENMIAIGTLQGEIFITKYEK